MTIPKITTSGLMNADEVLQALVKRNLQVDIDTVNWPEFPSKPKVTAQLAHDGRALYCRFAVEEEHVRVVTTESNGPVWEDSCVELFVMAADNRHYFNFETNAAGVILAGCRLSREEYEHVGADEAAKILRKSSLPLGTYDLRGVEAKPWSVMIGIPFALLGYETLPKELKLNLYKCGDKTDKPHFLSFAPIHTPAPDFHRPEYFTTLKLEQ